MRKLITQIWPMLGALFFFFVFVSPSYSDEYYRWVGEDGVVHYGSRPPEGVNAELVNTWGDSAAENRTPVTTQTAGADPAVTDQQQKVLAERKQQCEDEKQRLAQLNTPGRRIQMQQADGSVRYLTPEEIAKEVSASEQFISQACQ